MAERRGLDLSFSQVAAGALATVTATVLASFFGTFGTLIGAAASSVVSTAGAALYQHFFRRTGDRLKEAGQHVAAKGVLRNTLVSPHGTGMSTVKVPGLAVSPEPRTGGPESAQPRPGTRPGTPGSGTPSPERTSPGTTRPGRSGSDTATSSRPRPGRSGPRTLADVVGRSDGVTSRVGDDRSNGTSREATAGAFPIATGDASSQRPRRPGSESQTAGGQGAFGDRPEGGGTAKMGAFGDAEPDDDATRVDAADGAGDGAGDDEGGTHTFSANADGVDDATAVDAASADDADADGAGADGGGDETAVIGEGTNLAGSEDAETMAIGAMSGVSEVYTASTVRPRASLGEMLSWARGRWAVLLGGAVVLFAVVMGGVTLAEKVMQKPLSDAVRGRSGSGTSLFGGGSGGTTPTPEPTGTSTTTGTPSPTGSQQPTPGSTAQNTPNPAQTNPQPGQTSQQPLRPSTNPSSVPSSQPTSTGAPNGTNNQNNARLSTPAPPGQ